MEQLTKRNTILNINKNSMSSSIYLITAKEMKEVKNQIIIPEIQNGLDEDKVKKIQEYYKKNPHHIASNPCIIIAKLKVGNQQQYMLADGQHRLNAIINIYNEDNEDNILLVSIVNIGSKEELIDLFKSINSDSTKCVINNYSIFDIEIYELIKKMIKKDYCEFVKDTCSSRSLTYGYSEFVDLLVKNNIMNKIIENIGNNEISNIYKYLRTKEKTFFNVYGYLKKYSQNKSDFKATEIIHINHSSCMFMKNNNFIIYLHDNDIVPNHDFRKRSSISKELQNSVWEKEFGAMTSGKFPLYCCNNILSKNISNSWQCGHIISVKNGGETNLDNLNVICTPCNKKMSSTNWNEYLNNIMKQQIIDEEYFIDDEISCYMKKRYDCNNMINVNNFIPIQYKTKKGSIHIKPICLDCYNQFT